MFLMCYFFFFIDTATPEIYTLSLHDALPISRESFADMGRLLAPAGVVVLFFEPQTWWIADRLAGLLRDTFGAPPLAFMVRSTSPCLGFGGLMMVAGRAAALAPVRQGATARPEIRARGLP